MCLQAFQTDLTRSRDELLKPVSYTAELGTPVGLVRILEFLIWSEVEQYGHYRR